MILSIEGKSAGDIVGSVGRATAADIADLERCEVVGGEVVEKTSPSGAHGMFQGEIVAMLAAFRGQGHGSRPGGWWIGTEIEIEFEKHHVYLPDIAGWRIDRCPESPRGKPVRVVPDWVCEVLSSATAWRDLGPKLRGYHLAHVGHYWVVDPERHILHVMRWSDAGYIAVCVATTGDVVRAEPFDAIELDLTELFRMAGTD